MKLATRPIRMLRYLPEGLSAAAALWVVATLVGLQAEPLRRHASTLRDAREQAALQADAPILRMQLATHAKALATCIQSNPVIHGTYALPVGTDQAQDLVRDVEAQCNRDLLLEAARVDRSLAQDLASQLRQRGFTLPFTL